MSDIDGDFSGPVAIITTEGKGEKCNPSYLLWVRQDQLSSNNYLNQLFQL